MPILSKQNRDWAELFGRFSDAAYSDSNHGNYPGLERLKAAEANEPPTLIDISVTDTQALAAHWGNDLVIAFRGTEDNATDAATDARLARVNNRRGPGKVHRGFQSAANSAYKAVTNYIRSNRTQKTRIFLCGHSLGGALATLTASWLQNDASILHLRAVFTYGAPRVGNEDFVKNYHRQGLSAKTCSFLAGNDIVPSVPPYSLTFRHVTKHYHLTRGTVIRTDLDDEFEVDANEAKRLGLGSSILKYREVHELVSGRSTEDHSMKSSYLKRLTRL